MSAAGAAVVLRDHPRFTQALWYAWGQQDAGIGTDVDAFEFAYHHAGEAVAYEDVRDCRVPTGPSFLSSIQDAWRSFIAAEVTS